MITGPIVHKKPVKARKQYTCNLCEKDILPGTLYGWIYEAEAKGYPVRRVKVHWLCLVAFMAGDKYSEIKANCHEQRKRNEVIHQQLGVDGWQEIYADAPSEEDIRQEMAEDQVK